MKDDIIEPFSVDVERDYDPPYLFLCSCLKRDYVVIHKSHLDFLLNGVNLDGDWVYHAAMKLILEDQK